LATRLIINADNYGISPEMSRGIRYAHLNGIVTSTTCLMNEPNICSDIEIAIKETPCLGLGVQLTLTESKPLLPEVKIPSLVGIEGNFLANQEFIKQVDCLKISEVKEEWRAQIEAFRSFAFKDPTHLNTHHHLALINPNILKAFLELAREYKLPIRLPLAHGKLPFDFDLPDELVESIAEFAPNLLEKFQPRSPDAFFASFKGEDATRSELIRILMLLLPNGCFEIMCHPRFADENFSPQINNNFQSQEELEILTDPEMRKELNKREIQLINFSQL